MSMKLKTMEEVKAKLIEEFSINRIFTVSTKEYDLSTNPKGRNSKKDRRNWADAIFKELYNKDRCVVEKKSRCLGTGEYNFSYVKFAMNKDNEIFGVVHGKSSFHCLYPSDVWFYDVNEGGKDKVRKLFGERGFSWYTDEIIIIKNDNELSYKEAYNNEKRVKAILATLD